MRKPFRIFHFDIATENNFGDTLLFPAVKHAFEAYGAGSAFEVYDSRMLRENVGRALVEYINETADAVLVGGGGLFLSDTNPNKESGWQWRISLPMLNAIEVPIIVFAVGYNRFYGQPDFQPPFSEHVTRTLEKSLFFGLRNSGSIERMSTYVPPEQAGRILYQPCPTTLSSLMLPKVQPQPDEKRIGIQLSFGKRNSLTAIEAEDVLRSAENAIDILDRRGWEIVFTPFTKFDEKFSSRLGQKFSSRETVRVYGRQVLDRGISELSRIPMVLGCRGHGQMVPFGLGAMPFSFDVHPKLGYFLQDIGRSTWVKDPRDAACGEKMADEIEVAWDDREMHREHLAAAQQNMLSATQENLASIYRALGGDPASLSCSWKPYDEQGWNMAKARFLLELQLENGVHRKHAADAHLREVESELEYLRREVLTAERDRLVIESELLKARNLAVEAERKVLQSQEVGRHVSDQHRLVTTARKSLARLRKLF